jgi:hypothetical protein
MVQREVQLYRRVMEIAMADPAIDLAIVDRIVGGLEAFDDDEHLHRDQNIGLQEVNNFLIDFAKNNPYNKPLAIALDMYGNDLNSADTAAQLRLNFITSGLPAYPSLECAARAMARFTQYHEFQVEHGHINR